MKPDLKHGPSVKQSPLPNHYNIPTGPIAEKPMDPMGFIYNTPTSKAQPIFVIHFRDSLLQVFHRRADEILLSV
jgi:hypothetical protein